MIIKMELMGVGVDHDHFQNEDEAAKEGFYWDEENNRWYKPLKGLYANVKS